MTVHSDPQFWKDIGIASVITAILIIGFYLFNKYDT